MKKNIHPQYHTDTVVTCSCGHTFTTGSTLSQINVEICSACHPFFTGEMKFVDTQGRVEKFQALRQKAAKLQKRISKKTTKQTLSEVQSPKTLKEMMQEVAKSSTS